MKPEFSVILNRYDTTRVQLHCTMACLAAIRKFTDEPYEIIVVDNAPTLEIRDDYRVLEPYQRIVTQLNTVYKSYNIGAEKAKSDKFLFIQNDVYVHERTLNKLARYLDDWDVVFPQQVPVTRQDIKKIHKVKNGNSTHIGGRDAGLLGITRKAYDLSGGWDERFKNMLGEAAFYSRIDKAGLKWTAQTNALVTHIMAANNLGKEDNLYNKQMDFDAKLFQKEYK